MVATYYMRDLQPAHYLFEIDSFSKLQNTGVEVHYSNIFESGGYKWRLYLYPNGNKKTGGAGHVSLYLGIEDRASLPVNWRVNAIIRLFIKHLNDNKYLTVTDDVYERTSWRYDKNSTQWGFHKLISQANFKNQSKGYLRNDQCVFGAEVFVNEYTGHGESFTINKVDINYNAHTWQINNFSRLGSGTTTSYPITLGGQSWQLQIGPNGWGTSIGKNFGFQLVLNNPGKLSNDRKLYAEFNLIVKNKRNTNDKVQKGNCWFAIGDNIKGWVAFMPLADLKNVANGFLVNDVLKVEVQLISISVTKDF